MDFIREEKEITILSLKFWNSLSLKQKEQYSSLLEHYKSRSYNKVINKLNKGSIKNATHGAIKSFCDAHPNVLNKDYIQSLSKRIAGSFDNYIFNNKKLQDLF